MATTTIQAQRVDIQRIDRIEVLRLVQDNKTLFERFCEGAAWSAGAAFTGFIVVKVCEVAHRTFTGAQAGGAAGAALGPGGAAVGAVVGGAVGAMTVLIV